MNETAEKSAVLDNVNKGKEIKMKIVKKETANGVETITIITNDGTEIDIRDSEDSAYISVNDYKTCERKYSRRIRRISLTTSKDFGLSNSSIHTDNSFTSKDIKRRKSTTNNYAWTSLQLNEGFYVSVHQQQNHLA